MLSVNEIRRLADAVDSGWRTPVADAVAARWRVMPGSARWLRSSSTHVFVVPAAEGASSVRFLRFAPSGSESARRLIASATLMEAWARRGLRVARPIRSPGNRLTESVPTALGDMVGMLVTAAEGVEIELDELTEGRAAEWGAALGVLHRDGSGGPAGFRNTPEFGDLPRGDPELDDAVERIGTSLRALDSRVHSRGVCHGDFELDNLRFSGDGPTCFDADEAHTGWFAGDVALAVRDLTGVTLDSQPKPVLLAAFLDGYRSEQVFTSEEEQSLSLHGVAASVRLAAEIQRSLADAGREESMPGLRAQLQRHLRWHRARVLAWQG